MSSTQPRGLIGSVRRALRVLEIVAQEGDGVSAKAVARRAALTLSTTYHLLNTLVHEGYLVRLGHGRGFGLGYKIGTLHRALSDELDVDERVRQELGSLHRRARAAAYYTVLRDTDVVVAAIADSDRYPRARPLEFGFHEAAHATAYGKVLLSALSAKQRRDYLSGAGMPKLTEHTRVRLTDLSRELEQVRRVGLARDVEEFQPELACVSAPVRDSDDRVTGAVAFSVPAAEFAARRTELERHICEGAARLGRVLTGGTAAGPSRISAV
ncbi:IclR family transcriptional regulator [Saccharomonospora piscinae]|uniref:Transcriptional regulator n=1 Tax=Saccharomonospora piscinae TaxID=687388 RepID=A0A1V9A0C1_SACPI|nr:IclR family transcriptional regulator [Saccharomonospora piscinae]OQO90595.1 transcriptional regulator [Saccharomonospora piscinae]TLW93262.1 IclR family transcriptional regulator [Saccharomonospora piscinae]